MLSIRRLLLPPPDTKLHHPRQHHHKHYPRGRPRERKELASLARLHPNVVSVLINQIRRFDHDRRDERASQPNRNKRQQRDEEVETSGQTARRDDGEYCRHERDENQAYRNDVQHEHGRHERVERLDAILNILWPLEILQRDALARRLVQRLLDDARGVEFIHGLALAAARDVLANVVVADGGVCDFEGGVLPVAVVEHVGRVEVLDAQARGDFADAVVDGAADFVGDGVEEVGEGVGGVGWAGFGEEGFAEEGGVELGMGLVSGVCGCGRGGAVRSRGGSLP